MEQTQRNFSSRTRQNGSESANWQRWAPIAGAGALAIVALARRSKAGVALAVAGGVLAHRLTNGAQPRRFHAEASFALNCSPEQAWRMWRNFENLPLFMRHLKSVRTIGDRRSEWIMVGPAGREITWIAEIVEEQPNEWMIWHSLAGSEVEHSGSVEFRPTPGDRGTIVTAAIDYQPPAGALGRAFATVLGKNPQFVVREDLRRFKALVESGEVPTIDGQPHGPRSRMIKALHAVYPERRKASEATAGELITAQRRA